MISRRQTKRHSCVELSLPPVRMLIEVFTFGNNCQCFNDLIGISTISAVMMLLSC